MKRASHPVPGDTQIDNVTSTKKFRLDDSGDTMSLPNFTLHPYQQFEKTFPHFRQPNEIGCFSLDEKRAFHLDNSELRYFFDPSGPKCDEPNGSDRHYPGQNEALNLDLRAGYKQLIARDPNVNEKLDDMLRWILASRRKRAEKCETDFASQTPMGEETDFVCWRGLLTKLVCCPFENKEGWKFTAARFNGSLYLCDVETDQKIEEKAREDPRSKEMAYWGVKFEQYVTADKPDYIPVTSKPVNTNQAYVSVVRTRLGNSSLVFGGEVDCCKASDPAKYIELKTSRKLDFDNQKRNFKKFKLIKWWAQSFLIGIEEIVCGFRDDAGRVIRLETFQTLKIPTSCADVPYSWNADVCFNFLNDFLDHVKRVVVKEHDQGLYVFSWSPREPVRCELVSPDSEYSFLPSWFLDEFKPKGGHSSSDTTS